jgi:hypothetical protein
VIGGSAGGRLVAVEDVVGGIGSKQRGGIEA